MQFLSGGRVAPESSFWWFTYCKNHKLDEWREFCEWIKTLPYADELITMDGEKMEKTRAEDFFEKHPAAPKKDNIPVICVKLCGYGEYTECDSNCKKCWDMPMDE